MKNYSTDNKIIAEVWAAKDAIARKFNYDLKSLFNDSVRFAEQMKKEGYNFTQNKDQPQQDEKIIKGTS